MGKRQSDAPSDVAEALARRLAADPSDAQAYRALHDHYRAVGDYASLANLVAGLAAYTRDDQIASQAYQEVAELLEHRLDDAARAEGFYRKSLKRLPTNLEASEGLQALLERGGRLRELTALISDQVETLEGFGADARDIAVLCYRLGELWGKHFDRLDEALAQYRKAYELDPRLLRAVYEARQLQLQRGDRRAAAALYEKEAAAEPDVARKVLLLRELSDLYVELDDSDGAVSALDRARSANPKDVDVAHTLATQLLRRSAGQDERTRAADLDRVAALLSEISTTLPDAEALAFLGSALDHAPWHAGALSELERRTSDDPSLLAARWVAYLAVRPEGEGADTRRVALAQAYAQAGQLEDALFCLGPAVARDVPAALRLEQSLRGTAPARASAPPARPTSTRPPPPPPTAARPTGMQPPPTPLAAPAPARPDAEFDFVTQLAQVDVIDALRDQAFGEPGPWSAEPTSPGAPHGAAQDARNVQAHGRVAFALGEPDEQVDQLRATIDVQPTVRPAASGRAADESDEPDEQNAQLRATIDGQQTLRPAASSDELAASNARITARPEVPESDPLAQFAHQAHQAHDVPAADFADAADATDAREPTDAALQLGDDLDTLRAHLRELLTLGPQANAQDSVAVAERIVQLDPLDDDAFALLERHYRRTRDFAGRAGLLVRSAEQESLPLATRKQRLREAVSLLETRMSDVDGAVHAYRLLAQLETESDDAARGLKRLLERARRWDDLAALLATEVDAASEPSVKLALLRRLTEVHRRERGDRGAVADTLAQIAELDADDRGARVALTEELLHLGRFDEAASWLERRIAETSTKSERLPLLRQLASVFADRLHDQVAAYAAYERVLELAPDDALALDRMEEIDESSGAHERLLTTLGRRAARATPAQAAELHVRMATIAEADLLDRERAADLLRAALSLAPSNLQILTALSNLYERAERFAELLTLLRERVAIEKNVKARADLLRRIARLQAQRLDDEDAAATTFEQVLELTEDHESLLFLEGYRRSRDQRAGLCEVLRRLAELETEPGPRAARLFEHASLLVELDKPADAIAPLVRLLVEVDPDHTAAYAQLTGLCERVADFRGLARVLEQRRERAADADERADAGRALADLYEGKLPDEAKALRALGDWAQAAPVDPEPLRRLATIFERKRRYKDHVQVLDALANVEPSVGAQRRALHQAAQLAHEKLRDDEGAWQRLSLLVQRSDDALQRSVIDLARKAGKLDALCTLCETSGRAAELFMLLGERLDAEPPGAAKVELYRRLARAQVELAQDETAALHAYEGLLQLTDDIEALRFVQTWALQHDDAERLVHALGQLAKLEKNKDDRRDLLLERGRALHVRLGRAAEAIGVLEEALAQGGSFEPVLDALIAACEAAPDPVKLAAALERRLAGMSQADERLPELERLADLYERTIGDGAKAVHALNRWAEADETDPEPWRRLRAHHEKEGRWRELVASLDALATRETAHDLRVDAIVAAATVAHERMNDSSKALDRLLPIVAEAEPAADALMWRIARAAKRLPEALDAFERAERYDELATQLDAFAKLETVPAQRAAYLRRAARLCTKQLDEEARAFDLWTRVLELEEDAQALRFMQARARRDSDHATLANVLQRLAQLEQDPRELRDLVYERARLLSVHLARPTEAVALLKRVVFELDTEFEPALDELIDAAERAGDTATLAVALDHRLTREHEPAVRAELAQQLAALYHDRLNDPDGAIRALLLWSSADSADLTPQRKLRALLTAAGRNAELLACLDRIAEATPDASERSTTRLQAASLCARALQDAPQAWQRLLPLVHEGDREAEALLRQLAIETGRLSELAELYEQLQRYDELVELLRERAENETDKNTKAELYLRCARTLANAVGDELAATEAYRDVLGLREDAEALAYLRDAAERIDDVEALDDLLRRMALVHEDRTQRRDLLLARAMLLSDRLDRTADAIEVLRHIVTSIDPSCMPAIEELILSAEAASNLPALAIGLERKLVQSREPGERKVLAARLADLFEGELDNPDRAADALRRLCEADPHNVDALRRLRPHLLRQKTQEELLRTLDALANLESTKAARHEAQLSAAKLAHEGLGDARGAFLRLAPLVQLGDVEAEHLAELICKNAGLGRELAGAYIQRAQHAQTKDDLRASWRQVARIHETWLNEPAEALEASLRLLASDTDNRDYLDEVDRLGTQVEAFQRLAQVYAKLIKDCARDDTRVELLLRLASLLELQARDPNAALNCLLQACELPAGTRALDRTEALASSLGNHVELLWVHERRAATAPSNEKKALALLDAARTADIGLADREQANLCLSRALALTIDVPQLTKKIEELAGELDRARPALGKDDARRALVRAQLELAEHSGEPQRSTLVLRAAGFLKDDMHDEAAAFDLLRQGTSTPPFTAPLLDALEQTAQNIGRLDALIAHLSRSETKTTSSDDKLALAWRKARVLQERMGRFDQAAQAYERVLELAPSDEAAASALFACLRKAGRYRELLHAFERRLARLSDTEDKLRLMREMANVWEIELKNRASAMEVWNEVRTLKPEDAEAQQAIERLQRL